MSVKYGRIMDAKMGLLERIHGDSDLVNCNLAVLRLRNQGNNKKFVINNSVVVRVGEDEFSDEEYEPTRFSMSDKQ